MGLFSNRKEIKKLNETLTNSFNNVRTDIQTMQQSLTVVHQDIQNIYQWIEYLSRHSQSVVSDMSDMKKTLAVTPTTKEEIKRIVDYYYSFEDIIKKVRDLDDTLTSLTNKFTRISSIKEFDIASQLQYVSEIKELKERLNRIEEQSSKKYTREKLIKKITQKSRDFVRNLILSYIQKYEKISAVKLREMIVDEQGLASKSAFYRLLEEIEQYEDIEVVRDRKEKYYFFKAIKHT